MSNIISTAFVEKNHWMALANIKLLFLNLYAVRLVNVIYVRLKTLVARAINVTIINSARLIFDFFHGTIACSRVK